LWRKCIGCRGSFPSPANIAEGHALGSSREFSRFLAIAQGSLAELETHLLLAERLEYASSAAIGTIIGRCTEEAKMLRSLRSKVKERIKRRD
jgi:four helix bundle protein